MQAFQSKTKLRPSLKQSLLLLAGMVFLVCAPDDVRAAQSDTQSKPGAKTTRKLLGAEVKVTGSRVYLREPLGFEPSGRFSGFDQKSTGASLLVTEIPGPYSKVSAGFNKETMATKGLEFVSSEKRNVGKFEALMVDFKQSAYGTKFEKCAIVFGDDSQTVLATATAPADNPEVLSQLKASLNTIRYDETAALPSMDESLSYKIKDGEKLKKACRIANTLIYTSTGKLQPGKNNGPVFIVGESLAALKVENQEEFARKRLLSTPHLQNLKVDSLNTVKQAELPGIEIIAHGEDDRTNKPTIVYQVVLFGEDGYFIFQGLTGEDLSSEMLPEFKAIVQTFSQEHR